MAGDDEEAWVSLSTSAKRIRAAMRSKGSSRRLADNSETYTGIAEEPSRELVPISKLFQTLGEELMPVLGSDDIEPNKTESGTDRLSII